jgi:fatty acid desaturase
MSDSNQYADYLKKAGTPIRRRPNRDARDVKIHTVFNLVGMLAGAGAAYLAWDLTGSIALPIFALFATSYFVGRGIGDLVTDDKKVKRFFFFLMPVVIDSALIYLTYQWWGLMWLAVLIGVFVGAAIWAVVVVTAFADIQAEEEADNKERIAQAKGV